MEPVKEQLVFPIADLNLHPSLILGLRKRELFAMAALTALLQTKLPEPSCESMAGMVARLAFDYADAMVERAALPPHAGPR